MKKIVAYLATGILLGAVLMLLPATLSPDRAPGQGYFTPLGRESADAQPHLEETYKGLSGTEQPKNIEIGGIDGIGVLPSSLLYAGLISLVSLLLALGVYTFFKKRMAA